MSLQWKKLGGFFVAQLGWVCSAAHAQNLVPNPSFENFTTCPNTQDQLNFASPWMKPTGGSPDYYNACAGSGPFVGVPVNGLGNQTPHSGNAYAGFILRPSNNYREYIEVPLTSPLVAGVAYDVSFYVSLSDASQWAIDKFGAYLSVGVIGPVSGAPTLPYTPQVAHPLGNFITDKTNWTLISGSYTAAGGEDHLIIGNFSDNPSTTPVTGLGGFYPGSYYYIDDVSVTSAKCEPLPDGSDCTQAACQNPGSLCRPTKVIDDPATGQTTVIECGCDCFMRRSDVPPYHPAICTGGTCRTTGRPCQLQATPNHDGTTTYNCCADCSQPPVACCTAPNHCVNDDPLCCTQQGGISAGPGTSCTEPEMCCYADGTDDVQDPVCCTLAGGTPQGPGSGSAEVRPAACCFPNGTCRELNPFCCDELGGTYISLGVHCAGDTNGDHIDDACCTEGSFNDVTVIDLTTGQNDVTGAPIAFGAPDDTWRAAGPAPALVIDTATYFAPSPSPWAVLPPAEWISKNVADTSQHSDCYEACFCLNGDYLNAELNFSIYADNRARVYLNNSGCGPNATPLVVTPANGFTAPPTVFSATNHPSLKLGTNCIQVRVDNGTGPNGFTLQGQLTADRVQCCCDLQNIAGDLTSGKDDITLLPIQPGFSDDSWDITWAPKPGPLPRPAIATIEPVNGQGGIQSWHTIPPSRWISENIYGAANFSFPATEATAGPYYYESCFCLNGGFKNAHVSGSFRADDDAVILLNNCFVVATPTCTGTPPCSFNLPNPTNFNVTSQSCFHAGRNCVQVISYQKFGSVTGITLTGQFSADDALCCGGGAFEQRNFEECHAHGDMDCDNDTDLLDFEIVPGCMLGPAVGISPGCDVVNLADNSHIDLRDVRVLQNLFSGQ